jgi:hypothetical protein
MDFPFTATPSDSLRRATTTLPATARTLDLTVRGTAPSLPGRIVPVIGLRLPNVKDDHGHPVLLFGLQVNAPNSRWNGDDGHGDLLSGPLHGWKPGAFTLTLSIDLAQQSASLQITGADVPAQSLGGALPWATHAAGQLLALTIGMTGTADSGAYVPPIGWNFERPELSVDGAPASLAVDPVAAPAPQPTPAPAPAPIPLPPPAPSPLPTPLPPSPQPVPLPWPSPAPAPAPAAPNIFAQLLPLLIAYLLAHALVGTQGAAGGTSPLSSLLASLLGGVLPQQPAPPAAQQAPSPFPF